MEPRGCKRWPRSQLARARLRQLLAQMLEQLAAVIAGNCPNSQPCIGELHSDLAQERS